MDDINISSPSVRPPEVDDQDNSDIPSHGEERFRRYFELGLVGMFISLPDKGFREVNDRYCEILGYERGELLRIYWPQTTHPDDLAADIEAFNRVMAGEIDGYVLEKRSVRKDGRIIDTTLSVKCLRRDDGTVDYFVGLLDDTTERKQVETALRASEQALRRANETLERRVTARTASLKEALTERQELLRRVVTAQEEERRRLSRDLHDQTGQHLTGLALGLKSLETLIEPAYPAGTHASRLLEQLRSMAAEMAMEIHRIAVELRPTALDDLGLVAALQSHVQRWSANNYILAEFDSFGMKESYSGGTERFAEVIETTVYRVVQEALTNVARHGTDPVTRATHVGVTVQRFDGHLQATVEDNGPGFNVEAAKKMGRLGLAGMEERAASCGGTLDIESEPGKGTTVILRLPINPES